VRTVCGGRESEDNRTEEQAPETGGVKESRHRAGRLRNERLQHRPPVRPHARHALGRGPSSSGAPPARVPQSIPSEHPQTKEAATRYRPGRRPCGASRVRAREAMRIPQRSTCLGLSFRSATRSVLQPQPRSRFLKLDDFDLPVVQRLNRTVGVVVHVRERLQLLT